MYKKLVPVNTHFAQTSHFDKLRTGGSRNQIGSKSQEIFLTGLPLPSVIAVASRQPYCAALRFSGLR